MIILIFKNKKINYYNNINNYLFIMIIDLLININKYYNNK